MSDTVLLALIAGFPATIASISALIVVLKTRRQVEEVHKATNSMKDALVAAALVTGHAAGVKEERERKEP